MRPWNEAEIEHGYADVDGACLHYVEAGEGPLVLLLHGFPEFWFSWRHQILPLADAGFRVVAPDMRGTNLSSRPRQTLAYREETLGLDVLNLIEALGADRARVVGHDWGGWAAWWAAMQRPERVERLGVLNVPHPLVFSRARLRLSYQLLRAWMIAPGLPEATAPLGRLTTRAIYESALVKTGLMTREELDRYAEVWRRGGRGPSFWRIGSGPSTNPYRCQHHDRKVPMEQRCAPFASPVLVIYGAEDRYMGPELAQPPAELVPDAIVEPIPEADHWTQVEKPERVTELLLDFLKG
jgi:epoxide hydrolase 4